MAKPNSMTTLIRRYLAQLIEPRPAKGEAWCQDCVLNEDETLVLHESLIIPHLEAHKKYPDVHVSIIGTRITEPAKEET